MSAILFATVFGIRSPSSWRLPIPSCSTGAGFLPSIGWGTPICHLFAASPRPSWVFVLGLVVYYLLALIPIVGWVIMLLAVLSGLGAELIARRNVYVTARDREII